MQNSSELQITESQKNELINQLVSFALTDTLLFLPPNIQATKALKAINGYLSTEYIPCRDFNIPHQNTRQSAKLEKYLHTLKRQDIAFIYQIGKDLHSVLLSILLAEHLLEKQQAFELAFYEELLQQETWGKTEEIIKKHQTILQHLEYLDKQYGKRSISQN